MISTVADVDGFHLDRAAGRALHAATQADVFSFGVCLYELLHVRVVLNSVLQASDIGKGP
jgi:hypothetical protein